MYFPFLRGRQEELLALKAMVIAGVSKKVSPIIEPVNKKFDQIDRTLQEYEKANQEIFVIINPLNGIYSGKYAKVLNWFQMQYGSSKCVLPAILINQKTTDQEVAAVQAALGDVQILMAHFSDAPTPYIKSVADKMKKSSFLQGKVTPSYIQNVSSSYKILLSNTYTQMNNADYNLLEFFSDLHSKYSTLGYSGFGDFTTLENKYSTSGGQPYAVAIHMSFLAGLNKSEMWVNHFKSAKSATPGDAAGKFKVALDNMFVEVAANPQKFDKTIGFKKYEDCHNRQHFPGLGSSKRFSIMHHVETLNNYL